LYFDNCISPTKKGKTIRFYLVLWCDRVKKKYIFFFKLMFLDYFDVLILKINLKNKKNIILMYFQIQKHFEKQTLSQYQTQLRTYLAQQLLFFKVIFKLFFV